MLHSRGMRLGASLADTVIILNARAGTIRDLQPKEVEAQVREAFAGHTESVAVELVEGERFIAAIDKAAESEASTIIVGGGDGSASYAARKLIDSNRTLGVLPLGTMNLFARSLSIPADLNQALDILAKAEPARIDLGAVNGRIFHTLAGLGYFAEVARARAQVREDTNLPFGRYIAAARASLRAFVRPGILELTIDADGGRRDIETYALFIGNNRLSDGGFDRPRLDEGLLEVHYAEGADFGNRMQAAIDLLAGRWRENPAIQSFTAKTVTVRSRRPRLWVSVDGELTRLETPLRFECRAGALNVLMPAASDQRGAMA
ncbi:Diacylglycerol kinase family enzyme [Kaistia soli DSM 19436]|uniref:Diacylglycerol kinase family enzyme n=1 Tax=Kaistia soli DSM 19436 TaxID=1122133 RepID=A0A1M4ZLP5_9HYPH|nr:Diacylglycerol kinase family enzyme [Kaistia soli DSM 19436]